MRKRTRLLISTSVLVLMIGAIFFAGKPELSSAQNEGFQIYQLLVFCGNSSVASATFSQKATEGGTVGRPLMGTHTECVGNYCGGGKVSLADALARFPAKVSAALKAQVERHRFAGEGWFITCLRGGKEPPETKCEPPPPENNNPPWFNQDLPCSDRQRATISWSQTRASNMDVSFTVDICGEVIRYIYPGGGSPEKQPPGVRSFDVCCDSWRKGANTKSPCDARRDFDCDGMPNESDTMPEYAFRDRRSDDFTSKSPLTGLPFWTKLHERMPTQSGCKDCKWELVRVEYTCKDEHDPMRSARESRNVFDAIYHYQATWKCPTNGQTQGTSNDVTIVNGRCPTPQNRSWP